MERSNHDGASDDPFGDDGDDDALGDPADKYPRAPLPAHERPWRHPSEVGQAAWVMAEPPVALGRGLLVATGAIGVALGLAVLWMMFPIGGGSPPVAEPTVTRSIDGAGRDLVSTTLRASTTSASLPTSSSAPALGGTPAVVTLPAEDVPSGTVMLRASEPDEPAAIAVVIGGSPMMLTTEHAVGDLTELRIVTDGGGTSMATVVNVADSLAWLRPQSSEAAEIVAVGFATSAAAERGEVLHVLAPKPVSFTFDGTFDDGDPDGDGVGTDGTSDGDPDGDVTADLDVAEGTPVVNDDGALVALCSYRGDTVVFVPVHAPDDPPTTAPAGDDGAATTSVTTPGTGPTSPTTVAPPVTTVPTGTTSPAVTGSAWLGVRLAPAPDDVAGVPILGVTSGSPAERAGFAAGQRIVAIDGVSVDSSDEVTAILLSHRPGDVIVVSVIEPAPTTAPASTSTALAPTTTAPAASSSTAAPSTRPPTSPTTVGPTTSTASTTSTTTPAPSPSTTTAAATPVPATTVPPTGTIVRISVLLGEREPSV